jgi:hypothetical protein
MAAFTQAEDDIAMATTDNSHGPADTVAFHHPALFSPALSTVKTTIQKGCLPHLPGLKAHPLTKYPPPLEATTMRHLDNRRKNIKSTKKESTQNNTNDNQDAFPTQPINKDKTHTCYVTTEEPRQIVCTDQTGRFPIPSSTGNNYLLIAYDYDSNSILLRPIK